MSDHEGALHATNTGIDNRKFGMWVLIASECFLFGTLIANYLVNRARGLSGPKAQEIYEIDITTLSTFDLLMSSVAMVLALHGCQNRDVGKFRFWTGIVVLGGVIFLGFQYYEFSHFVHNGLGLTTSIFGSSFYLLTGCHGLHVLAGVLWMSTILATSFVRGDKWFPDVPLEVAGLYWHFVDVVWIVIFTVVYLFVYI
ncbi:MAG: cytochrome c oxidase subunit 3 [Zetaproteobacteria bacterium]|nr:cytochrome c oxidase subunit 3 [Zetaproteobacteria bacterium]